MEEDVYTAPQAARILGLSDRRVRQMLEAGELIGERDDSGKWWIPQRVVHEALEGRGSPRGAGGGQQPRSSTSSAPGGRPYAGEPSGAPERPPEDRESVRELMARVEDLSYRLGRSEARAELTERTESTIREERDRLLRELEEERAERRRLAERLEQLEEERQEAQPADIPSTTPEEASQTPEEASQPAQPRSEGAVPVRRSSARSWWKRIFR